jgi:hypothetical protein
VLCGERVGPSSSSLFPCPSILYRTMSPRERAVGPAGPFGAMHCSCSDALLIRRPLVRCIFESYGLRTTARRLHGLTIWGWVRRHDAGSHHKPTKTRRMHGTRSGGHKRAGRPQPCGPRKTTVAYAHAHRSQSGWGGGGVRTRGVFTCW